MKRGIIILFVFVLLAGVAATVRAEPEAVYSLSWWTIDAGGGQNISGGAYSLSATAGQPDAATASGSGYTVFGGFWAPGVVQPAYKILIPVMRR